MLILYWSDLDWQQWQHEQTARLLSPDTDLSAAGSDWCREISVVTWARPLQQSVRSASKMTNTESSNVKHTQLCLTLTERSVLSVVWVCFSSEARWEIIFSAELQVMQKGLTMRPRPLITCHYSLSHLQLLSLTFQSQLFECSVSSRLQQLPHDPVRLLHVPLHHRHPLPIPGQDGRHSWAKDPGPNYHHIRLWCRWGATGWGALRGRGRYVRSFPCSPALGKNREPTYTQSPKWLAL